MKLLFNFFILWKAWPVLSLRFGLREANQEQVFEPGDLYPAIVAERFPEDEETLLAACGAAFALNDLLF